MVHRATNLSYFNIIRHFQESLMHSIFGADAANDDGKLSMGLKARLASGAEEIDPRAISSMIAP